MTDHERYRAAVRNAQHAVDTAVVNARDASMQMAVLLETYGDSLPDGVRMGLATAADGLSLDDAGSDAASTLIAMPKSLPGVSS